MKIVVEAKKIAPRRRLLSPVPPIPPMPDGTDRSAVPAREY
jgi:hypothetical protein